MVFIFYAKVCIGKLSGAAARTGNFTINTINKLMKSVYTFFIKNKKTRRQRRPRILQCVYRGIVTSRWTAGAGLNIIEVVIGSVENRMQEFTKAT